MSLINQMLRDLETRRATERHQPAGLFGGLSSSSSITANNRPLLLALLLVLVVLLALVGYLVWDRLHGVPAPLMPASIPTASPPPAMAAETPPRPMPETAVAVAAPVAPAEEPAPPVAAPAPPMVAAPEHTPPAAPPVASPPIEPARTPPASIMEKTARLPSAQQRAAKAYQEGIALLREGKQAQAESALREALRLDREHLAAREALAAMLLSAGRLIEADEVLEGGRRLFSRNITLALLLARLRVEQGQTAAAVMLLEQYLPVAEAQPDYLAFLAALYQRELRYNDSIASYQRALTLAPQQAAWWAGLGISLEGAQRLGDARQAYQQAASGALPAQLQDYVQGRLKALPTK